LCLEEGKRKPGRRRGKKGLDEGFCYRSQSPRGEGGGKGLGIKGEKNFPDAKGLGRREGLWRVRPPGKKPKKKKRVCHRGKRPASSNPHKKLEGRKDTVTKVRRPEQRSIRGRGIWCREKKKGCLGGSRRLNRNIRRRKRKLRRGPPQKKNPFTKGKNKPLKRPRGEGRVKGNPSAVPKGERDVNVEKKGLVH